MLGDQFSRFLVTREESSEATVSRTTHRLWKRVDEVPDMPRLPHPNRHPEVGDYTHSGIVAVTHKQGRSAYAMRPHGYDAAGDGTDWLSMDVEHRSGDGADTDGWHSFRAAMTGRGYASYEERAAAGDLMHSEQQGRPKLFGEEHILPKSTLTYLATSKEDRIKAPGLIGLAQVDTWNTHGARQVRPDADLSRHSERIVGRLQGQGLVDPHFQKEHTNSIDWLSSQRSQVFFRKSHPRSRLALVGLAKPEDVRAGQRLAREVLRKKRTGPVPQVEQLSLFNEEP